MNLYFFILKTFTKQQFQNRAMPQNTFYYNYQNCQIEALENPRDKNIFQDIMCKNDFVVRCPFFRPTVLTLMAEQARAKLLKQEQASGFKGSSNTVSKA